AFAIACASLACSASDPQPQSASDSGRAPSADADAIANDVDARDVAEASTDADASADVDPNACFPFGAPGECMTVAACAAIADHSSYAGYCPGPSTIECCIKTPNVADDPPVPAGWKLMQQSEVTPDMTSWAVSILHDPTTYPMFSTTTKLF